MYAKGHSVNKFNKPLLMIGLALALLLVMAPALAQSELSDDELALLDRVLAAAEAQEEPGSYVSEYESVSAQQFDVSLGDVVQSIVEEISVTGERTITTGDETYGQAFYTVGVTQDQGFGPTSFVIDVEFRYVDGALYAIGEYVESEGDVPPIEEGWIVVEDAFAVPYLNLIDVEELLGLFEDEAGEDAEGEEGDTDIIDALALIRDQATSVTLEEVETGEATFDGVTIAFGWDGLLAILEAEGEAPPPEDPIFSLFGETLAGVPDVVQVTILLDEDDTIRGLTYSATIEIGGIDLGEIDPTAAGAVIDTLVLELFQSEAISSIGEAFEVPEVPEVTTAG